MPSRRSLPVLSNHRRSAPLRSVTLVVTLGAVIGFAQFGAADARSSAKTQGTTGALPDPSLYKGLVWRNIGPFRGGRISAVSGVIGQPGVFYIGLPLGGVWKTTSAGETWFPIFDSIKEASSVGAVAVAPSDPNVIYVGMGDMITGGGINEGNGLYKSVDAGKTWTHLGLEGTKQIPSILVDPHDPNVVLVATQGNVHALSDERGLYRSTDGGKTWTKTLFVDEKTGIQKITWAPENPEVMLATTVNHYAGTGGPAGRPATPPAPRPTTPPGTPPATPPATPPTTPPVARGGQRGAGPGTALYKSTDEGKTWKQLTGGGLPDLFGRTCVAIAPGTDSKRMYLVGNFGLYRSDDGGMNWRHMDATDGRVANGQGGYNCGVYVDPKNPDSVYLINTSSYHSMDGGNTFTGFKGAPGGDDPQQMWIDPTDGKRMLLGTDQGATVSLDGGGTWSSWYNQPTAQVYHISTDNQFPYWVYATQQDSGCIATSSRGNFGEITPLDWLPHPGYEFGSIVADPRNPKITYAGSDAGGIAKVTYPNGQQINVSPNVNPGEALRKVGNQPLAYSPTNPNELMAGFQYLMSTTDGGMHWKKLSPDLGAVKGAETPVPAKAKKGAKPTTAPKAAPKAGTSQVADPDEDIVAQGNGNQVAGVSPDGAEDDLAEQEMQFGGGGGAIESFSSSSVNGGTIWVGTNNGMIKVTKDHGRSWADVTIPGLPNPTRADIVSIEGSHHDLATAYAAIDYHNTGDYAPYFYRTNDYGKSWTRIVTGLPTDLPSGCFSRVIRADTVKPGLLFAGTESFVYVSFDDGDHWQSLALNLPNTSYRDMQVHGNDLVVGTYGRGFWVLDDISPLRQLTPSMANETAHLFKPGDAIRVRRNVNGDTPFPPEVPHALNAPDGAIIYYTLAAPPAGVITLDVTDSAGKPVRHLSSAPIVPLSEPPPPVPDFWVEKPKPMPTETGMNRINWNLRYDAPPAFSHSYEINANPGATPASPEGPLVAPGVYKVTLTVDGKSYSQMVTVSNDPRSPASGGDLRRQHELQMKLYVGATEAWDAYHTIAAARTQLAETAKGSDAVKAKAATELDAKLLLINGDASPGRRFGGFRRPGGPAPAPTFATVQGALIRELTSLDSGDMAPPEATLKACQATLKELAEVQAKWKALQEQEMSPAKTSLPAGK